MKAMIKKIMMLGMYLVFACATHVSAMEMVGDTKNTELALLAGPIADIKGVIQQALEEKEVFLEETGQIFQEACQTGDVKLVQAALEKYQADRRLTWFDAMHACVFIVRSVDVLVLLRKAYPDELNDVLLLQCLEHAAFNGDTVYVSNLLKKYTPVFTTSYLRFLGRMIVQQHNQTLQQRIKLQADIAEFVQKLQTKKKERAEAKEQKLAEKADEIEDEREFIKEIGRDFEKQIKKFEAAMAALTKILPVIQAEIRRRTEQADLEKAIQDLGNINWSDDNVLLDV